ncbi:DUF302 domain-containing protein [Pseudosulfitobacter sp. SM2401]|uniref:DUF302 domain-containing protein n=1 Tax=Pseudosulfitobacter sp. SM2401 TaxID=3350098 RepID=UPI0036F4016F
MTQLITKPSPHSVDVTLDRLEAAIKGAGAIVFARVDHAKGAASVDQVLRPTQMLMFGNPMLGTPLMQAAQTAGLDLPLRVVCYQNASGDVHLSYHAPAEIAATHSVPSDAETITKMTGALDNLTNKAIAAD